jgi:hypothetical protein
MGVLSLKVSLRAWHPDGRQVQSVDFIGRLSIGENDPVVEACESNGQWQAARVCLLAMYLSDFKQDDEPTEVFAHAVSARLQAVADWLARQPIDAFEQASHSGMRLDLFFNPWIDDDQLDLDLPSVLLLECGKRRLPIQVITND